MVEARAVPRLEGQAFQALPPAMQVATLSIDDLVVAER
jgi:hypothetical protein